MKRQQVENIRDEMLIHLHTLWTEETADDDGDDIDYNVWQITESLHASCCQHLETLQAKWKMIEQIEHPLNLAIIHLAQAAMDDPDNRNQILLMIEQARSLLPKGGVS